tara:strand:- start:38 stop:463 length:426 start_codon:yes stop_codon:yes gene_type:complete
MDTEKNFSFYTDEELIALSKNVKLSLKRQNKQSQIVRLSHAVEVILRRIGFESEKQFELAIFKGEVYDSSLYDAYLVAKYERNAARLKIGQMPPVEKKIDIMVQFFYDVKNNNPSYWNEMKERAAKRCAVVSQKYREAEGK